MFKLFTQFYIPCIIGAALSVLAISYFGWNTMSFGDAEDYINAANSFLNGTPYPLQSVAHPMFRPPLFSYLVACIWTIFPASVIAVKIAQVLFHVGTVCLAYITVFEILRKQVPAFLGSLIVAVNPLLVAHTVDLYTEPLHTFLCLLAMFLLVKFLRGIGERVILYALLTGVVFGLAALCRPAVLGIAASVVAALLVIRPSRIGRLNYGFSLAVLTAAIFLTILPWTYQNYKATGEFILVNDGFGYNLWLGNLPGTIRLYEGNFASKEENQAFANYYWGEIQKEKLNELEQTDGFSSLGINERERVWRREAMKNVNADPWLTARLMAGKFRSFWTPFLNRFSYGDKVVNLVALFVITTYILGAYGIFLLLNDETGWRFIILLLVGFAATTIIHVLIFGFVRYRVPNVDPYLSMMTGVAVWSIANSLIPGTLSKLHLNT